MNERVGTVAPRRWHQAADLVHGPGWRRMAVLRRALAVALLLLAAILALAPTRPGVDVLVAGRDLSPGATIAAADVVLRSWPAELVPAGVLHAVADADGRVLAGAARAGEPLTDLRLAGPALAAGATGSPNATGVPVRLADPDVAALLGPGSRVDVVTTAAEGAEPVVLAADAVVLTVLADDGRGAAGRGRLVLVALPREIATRVAAASLTAQVAVTLR
ncbi:MAG: SAF domain-containing protein [Pseudonocardia sp.]|nr:SAF domain-containing protein [Pseudonocardia sp.]